MPGCSHVGCHSGYGKPDYLKTHFFKIPKSANEETKAQWMKNIPKQKNRQFNFKTSVLCYKHFEDKFIIKQLFTNYNGIAVLQGEQDRWTLKDDAVPSLFENDKVRSIYNCQARKRKPPTLRSTVPRKKLAKTCENQNLHKNILKTRVACHSQEYTENESCLPSIGSWPNW